jgi:DNA modification methylase
MESITVTERFRQDYGDVQSLADSIKQEGLLQPLVLDSDHNLLAGGRRYQAIKLLGWERVECHYIYELDDISRRRIELAENIHRKDLTWQERAKLFKEIQRFAMADAGITPDQAQQIDPQNRYAQTDFSTRKLAEVQGVSAMTVVREIRLGNALEIMPSLEQETSQTNALRKIERMIEDIERALDLRAKRREVDAMQDYIKEGDATSLILSLDSHSVDCIITDPPYGTGNLDGNIYKYREQKDYDDSPEATLALIRSIGPELRRVLKPDGHLWAFFGPPLWAPTITVWKQAGFELTNIIAIWYKSGGATGTVNWDYDLAPDWEPFLLAHNRERKLSSKHGATFVFPPDLGSSRLHPNQKPLALIRELVTLSTRPGDMVLDPFAGSGTTAVACKELGRKFIVFDNDHRNIQIIKERLINTRSQGTTTTAEGLSMASGTQV